MKHLIRAVIVLLMLFTCAAAESFAIEAGGPITGFTENTLLLSLPANGEVEISVSQQGQDWRVIGPLSLEAGFTRITWDGLGLYEQPLREGTYTITAIFTDASGRKTATTAIAEAGESTQAMLYALPSSDTLWLSDDKDAWFIQLEMVRAGNAVMEVIPEGGSDAVYTKVTRIKPDYTTELAWDGKGVSAGTYTVKLYAEENPRYTHSFTLTIREGKPDQQCVTVTGPVMPTRGMTDTGIWAIMQQTSVVIDIGETSHQPVYSKPRRNSDRLGTLHGGSQCVEVLAIEGSWAKIGAWIHENGSYVEGYVPLSVLKTVKPDKNYCILIDKQSQTLTVFCRGERIGTMPVSTGLMTKRNPDRETPAGSYLTVIRLADFRSEGYRYHCAIRYDGGNLLHSLGSKAVDGDSVYTDQLPELGSKASHGCVRMQLFGREGDLTAYWLWKNIPYHTRVIILDDPDERASLAASLGVKLSDMAYTGQGQVSDASIAEAGVDGTAPFTCTIPVTVASGDDLLPGYANNDELILPEASETITITLGGDAVIGTREAWMTRADALPAVLEEKGAAWFFSGLADWFTTDDMTFINLECTLKSDSSGENTSKQYRFRGSPSWTEVLFAGSVEQVNIANNHVIDYGQKGFTATKEALTAAGMPYSGYGTTFITEINGHKIGFGGCRETIWKQDKGVIKREIKQLKEAGCEVIIWSCHWGTEYDPQHNSTQGTMARAAVEAGADLVIGTHPHVVQGISEIDGVPVLWSLGNLMFGGTIDMTTFDATLARVTLRFDEDGYEGCIVQYVPILTSSSAADGINDYHPVAAEGFDRIRILTKIANDSDLLLQEQMYFSAK